MIPQSVLGPGQSTRSALAVFAAMAVVVVVLAWVGAHSEVFAERPALGAAAVTFDLTLTLPLLYLLFARRYRWPLILALPLLTLGLLLAERWVLPQEGPLANVTVSLVVAAELVVAFVLVRGALRFKGRLGETAGGWELLPERLEQAFPQRLGRVLAAALATEIAGAAYALACWRSPNERSARGEFTYGEDTGYRTLLAVIVGLIVVETAILHLVVSQWSHLVAWILTGTSLYSLLFVAGHRNAIPWRPLVVEGEYLQLRCGLSWRVAVPLEEVESVARLGLDEAPAGKDVLTPIRLGDPNVLIELRREHVAQGPYGIRKRFKKAALQVDDAPGFVAFLEQALTQSARKDHPT